MRQHGEHIFLLWMQTILTGYFISPAQFSVFNKRWSSVFCKSDSLRVAVSSRNQSADVVEVPRRVVLAEKQENSETVAQLESLDMALSECLEQENLAKNIFDTRQHFSVSKTELNGSVQDKPYSHESFPNVPTEISIGPRHKGLKNVVPVKNCQLKYFKDNQVVQHSPIIQKKWHKIKSHQLNEKYKLGQTPCAPAEQCSRQVINAVHTTGDTLYFDHSVLNTESHKNYNNCNLSVTVQSSADTSNEDISPEEQNIIPKLQKCLKVASKAPKSKQRKNHEVPRDSQIEIDAKNVKTKKQEVSKIYAMSGRRFNEVNIEMLPLGLHEQIFGSKLPSNGPTSEQVELSRKELQKHNLLKSVSESEHSTNITQNEKYAESDLQRLATSKDINHWSPSVFNDVRESLEKERENTSDVAQINSMSLNLPPLLGQDIEEHFHVLGEQQAAPYRSLLLKLINTAKLLPSKPQPSLWEMRAGWTRYDANGSATAVNCPPEDALVFDVEVSCEEGVLPTLAVAAAPESQSWYGWVSQSLSEGSHGLKRTGMRVSPDDMIPLESWLHGSQAKLQNQQHPRVVVAHHAAFDRSRVREQYSLCDTGTRFVDTLSLHVCVSSVTDEQRMQLRSGSAKHEPWSQVGSLNALQDLAKLYCPNKSPPDKSLRDVFVKGSLEDIRGQFPQLMDYCASDVSTTLAILEQLLPLFLERFPHPVTLAGMLELGTAFLPVDDSWNRYLMEADATFEELNSEIQFLIAKCANTACQLMHNDAYKSDTWMWDQDWSVQELKLKQQSKKKKYMKTVQNVTVQNVSVVQQDTNNTEVRHHPKNSQQTETRAGEEEKTDTCDARFDRLAQETAVRLPVRLPYMPGYPNWYRKLCSRDTAAEDWCPSPQLLTTGMQITPKLLRLSWEGYPLHYLRGYGWGFLLPQEQTNTGVLHPSLKTQENTVIQYSEVHDDPKDYKSGPPVWYQGTGVWTGIEVEGHWFLKLPHKDGISSRVGNPLSRDFMSKFAEQVLTGDCYGAQRVLEVGRMLSYWRNNRDRVHGQVVAWHSPNRGVLLPQVIVSGTVTRRAVESTWMTASNARTDRVGSELRAMVRAPPSYCIVGADVDSQELWIAALLGDAAQVRIHGGTPLGWMTLAGKKKDGTDMHSVTASAAGISRDQAKVLNYARIYGAGSGFAQRVLQQFNPCISESKARSSAQRMFALTKGQRRFRPLESLRDILGEEPVTKTEALRYARRMGKPVSELFHPPQWEGGTESAMFNRLEEIACTAEPRTPFLGGRLTRALERSDDRTLPTRVNWVVQSGAVDFLHLLLVSLRWLLPKSARFCLSFHDEVRYIVPERDCYRAATAMHISNLMARAFCSSCVGLYDLPLSVAFFSSVEVDKVLRKEASDDCVTPSNPHGLSRGYGVPPGESLDLMTALKLCNYKPWAGLPCLSKADHNIKGKKGDSK